jgi:hypothetical protein
MSLTFFYATYVSILTSDTSTVTHVSRFIGLQNAPLPLFRARSFGVWFKPRYILGAG